MDLQYWRGALKRAWTVRRWIFMRESTRREVLAQLFARDAHIDCIGNGSSAELRAYILDESFGRDRMVRAAQWRAGEAIVIDNTK